MRADTTLRPDKHPRGLILSTGEELPTGSESLRARIFSVEVNRGDIIRAKLTEAQRLGGEGVYVKAMGAYIRWLAGRLDAVRAEMREKVAEFRARADSDGHARHCSESLFRLDNLFGVCGRKRSDRDAKGRGAARGGLGDPVRVGFATEAAAGGRGPGEHFSRFAPVCAFKRWCVLRGHQRRTTCGGRRAGGLLAQASFADAGLTGNQKQPAAARQCIIESRAPLGKLAFPSDECVAGCPLRL